jgi:benzoyl-CoA reductase/2-hydroxyglutaryl-CoA dehydratase subunit BcrC/BadD/HgdB
MAQKYVDLWTSLGIDLEKHNQLLAVLPKVYTDLVLSQKNRPKKMDYFDFVISEIHGIRVEELDKLRKEGNKIVGAFCLYAPEELAYAANATMVGLCGGADFSIPDAEAVLPRNLCPLIKSFYGFKIGLTCPYFQCCDMLVGETTCDGKKKVYELLNEHVPTYVIEVPHKPDTEQGRSLWLKELQEFKAQLEKLTGNTITAEKLKASIELINGKRKALKRLAELRKATPAPISGLDALVVIQIGFYDDVKRFTAKVNELCDELEQRVKDGVGVTAKNVPRLMVSGCPMAVPNWKLPSIAESAGASIVVEESCVGSRYFMDMVEPKGESLNDLLEALVEKYAKIPCACFTPNDARVDIIDQLAKDFKVDGVVYYTLQFCHSYNVEAVKVGKALKGEGVPMLKIETDYTMEDAEQIRTRLEAFLEMIKGKGKQ